MTKRVLDVGSCGPDYHLRARLMRDNLDVVVEQAHSQQQALDALRGGHYDLVTINRIIDRDGSEGLEIIKSIKADAELCHTPVMMITNLDAHQQLAVSAGAAKGFGKSQLDSPATIERLRPFLT